MAAADQNEKKEAAKPAAVVGATSGVSVSSTWIQVFERNAEAEAKERLTDPQISDFMKSEFPGVDGVTFDRVEIARGKFNRGGFHRKDPKGRVMRPKIKSEQHGGGDHVDAAARNPSKNDSGPMADRIVAHKRDFKSNKK